MCHLCLGGFQAGTRKRSTLAVPEPQGLVLVTLDVVNLIPGRGLGPQVRAHHTGARPAGIQQCYSLI